MPRQNPRLVSHYCLCTWLLQIRLGKARNNRSIDATLELGISLDPPLIVRQPKYPDSTLGSRQTIAWTYSLWLSTMCAMPLQSLGANRPKITHVVVAGEIGGAERCESRARELRLEFQS